jgi:mercuric reductase
MFRKKYDFDLAIIGSGAGGSVGAHHAVSLGKKVVMFEKGDIGGECPNWACVPTKALLHAAEVYQIAKDGAPYGVEVKGVELDYPKVKKWKDLVVSRTGAAHGEESFKSEHIKLIREKAILTGEHEIEAGGEKYTAHKILLATGSDVSVPPIEGLKESGYITFREAVDFESLPKSIFILGGGPIGCEFAQVFSTFGSEVIVADVFERLLFREEKEVGELVQALFENRGIKVLVGIKINKIEKKGNKKIIHYQKGDAKHTVETDEILVAAGKRPVLDFGPEKAGIKVDEKGHIHTDYYLQTNKSNIYAAGDIVGPYLFTHTGYYQSYIAVNNMFSRKKIKPDYSVVPRCVFTNPEVASVGTTEALAIEDGIKVRKGIIALSMLGRANTSNEFDGFVKIVTDKQYRILGASIVGPHAGEMIHELALAVRLKVKSSVIADMLHAYPTFSEGIKIACSVVE